MYMYMYSCALILCVVPQDHVDIGTATRHSHLHGVSFPIDQDALEALEELKNKRSDYVQLVGNVGREEGGEGGEGR